MPFSIRDSGIWKTVSSFFVHDAGAWKPVQNAYVKDGGSWKKFFPSFGNSQVFSFVGVDEQFTVPAGVTKIRAKVWAAGGGGGFLSGNGGGGGFVQGELTVVPGDVLTVRVGGGGEYANETAGGWPNGNPALWNGAGAGGGASYLFILANVLGAGAGGGASDGNTGGGDQPGSPGGTTTGAAATGGDGGDRFNPGGAGGDSCTTGWTATIVTAGSANAAGNDGDSDYAGSAGRGGTAEGNGNNGRIVVRW